MIIERKGNMLEAGSCLRGKSTYVIYMIFFFMTKKKYGRPVPLIAKYREVLYSP